MTGEPDPNPGIARVRDTLNHLKPVPTDGTDPDRPQGPGGDGPPTPPRPTVPEGCPVTPLGVHGQIHWYLDVLGQLRGLKPNDHGRTGILALFGYRNDFLYETWPRKNDQGTVVGWNTGRASEVLMAACAAKGVWDPIQRVRGCGAWVGGDGGLILHAGDALIVAGQTRPTGALDGLVYPSAPPGPRPLTDPPGSGRIAAGQDGPAARLEALFRAWNWAQGPCAARLLLGWMCTSILGGALAYRPVIWLSGERGTGKTTVMTVAGDVLGDVISSSDASAAGIWQRVGHASVPIAIDEMEPDADPRHAQAVIKLARQAASGGLVLRGGQDHHGAEFLARSCFLFSSILVPPLTPADRSRIAVLDLLSLDGVRPPALVPHAARELGAGLRRRLVDRWGDWPGRLETWQQAVVAVGHGGRGADAWGTLLAAADLALHEDPPDADTLAEWAELVRPDVVAADDLADWEECLEHLLTSQVDAYRGGLRHAVAYWVGAAAGATSLGDVVDDPAAVLATLGCKLVRGGEIGRDVNEAFLAIANKHQGTAKLFEDTRWRAGVWKQALQRVPGAERYGALRIGGRATRVTLLPIDRLIDQNRS